ncbi:MAG: hypothetical protein LBV42_04145, partial [Methanobrevibacter sp.]|nr:hypothetical protein [Methanobrevibacter sp.]
MEKVKNKSHNDPILSDDVSVLTNKNSVLNDLDSDRKTEGKKSDIYVTEKQTRCDNCGSSELKRDYQRAEIHCLKCGLVIAENLMDEGPEWRSFDREQNEKRARAGAPSTNTIHDRGLSTMIDLRNKDIHGRDIPARNRAQWYRLRKWQRKIRIS